MPPEETLSLKSTPPEVSVVLPTGQDGVGASEDVEVWRVTTGNRKRSEPEELAERRDPSPAARETPYPKTLFPLASALPNQPLLSHSRHSPSHSPGNQSVIRPSHQEGTERREERRGQCWWGAHSLGELQARVGALLDR